ncbi:MAG: AI-2E family transporter [Planctomycetota bacterium]
MDSSQNSWETFGRQVALILLATTMVAAVATTLVVAKDFILLLILGILFGVFLTKTASLLKSILPIGYEWNLVIVMFLLLLLLGGGLTMFGVQIENRLNQTSLKLDEANEKLNDWLDEHQIAAQMFKKIPFAKTLVREAKPEKSNKGSGKQELPMSAIQPIAGQTLAVFQQMLGTTLGMVANLGLMFFVGVFLAINPTLYRDGFARLFAKDRRDRVKEVMDQMGEAMFAWLNGRFIAMLITGLGTAIALLILGVPMPFTIGVITGLLTFIPNLGGLIALALAMIMALTQGPMTMVWVIVIYAGLQLIESNIITPLVQQHQTSIPPALLLSFQVVLGALTGFLGLLVATPLLAAGMVVVRQIWIRDILGDEEID